MTQTIADRYTVTGRIGAGGGGTVWRATDETLGRTVAIKEVELPADLPQADRDRVRTRALREARAAARLEHRSVVSIYDVLEGLAAAHGAGVVHRGVKPSNVLVHDPGPAVVTDFGVAAVLGESGLTRTGKALGTPDYISPEQLEDGPVGPACDLWSLGATLYDAVEGVPPFRRQRTMATIHAVATAEPRPPERAGPLQEVLLQLLTKEPSERPDVATTRRLLHTAAHDPADRPSEPVQQVADETRPLTQSGTDTQQADRPAAQYTDRSPEGRPPERRRAALVLGGLLAVSALVAGVALNSGGGTATGEQPDPASEAATSSSQEQPPALPEGWQLHEDDRYAVGVSSDWEPRDAPGSAVDLAAPSGEAYLRVADTDDPAADVLADTERIRDSFRSRYPTYEEVALEPVEYRGHDAVRWEYTYTPGDQTLRAVHLNFSTGDRGYALNYQAPAARWDELSGRFDDFTATFRTR